MTRIVAARGQFLLALFMNIFYNDVNLQGAVINSLVANNVWRAECKGAYRSTTNSERKTCATHISGMSLGTVSKHNLSLHLPQYTNLLTLQSTWCFTEMQSVNPKQSHMFREICFQTVLTSNIMPYKSDTNSAKHRLQVHAYIMTAKMPLIHS